MSNQSKVVVINEMPITWQCLPAANARDGKLRRDFAVSSLCHEALAKFTAAVSWF
jgi:hypothetical protein